MDSQQTRIIYQAQGTYGFVLDVSCYLVKHFPVLPEPVPEDLFLAVRPDIVNHVQMTLVLPGWVKRTTWRGNHDRGRERKESVVLPAPSFCEGTNSAKHL